MVNVREYAGNLDRALSVFRREVLETGLAREMRRRMYYVGPSEARKIKSVRARRRRQRKPSVAASALVMD
jgi:ribosomal protein S21